jgi:hypothetical protein
MKIVKLIIKNFKGIDELEINFDGKNAVISGDNAAGKSSVADAICWGLFNKSSLNQADFEIKPKNHESDALNVLETSVEIIFNEISLKKILKEKWTKKRGSAESEFCGHTTEYFIDGLPVKESEYKEKVSAFKQELMLPLFFNQNFKWEERRSLLFNIFGNLSDTEIMQSKTEFSPLLEINTDLDNYKKVLKSELTKINDSLKIIPARIDENKKGISAGEGNIDFQKIAIDCHNAKLNLQKLESKKSVMVNNSDTEIKKQISELQLQQAEIKNKIISENNSKIQSAKNEKADLQIKVKMLSNSIIELNKQHSNNNSDIECLKTERKQLIEKWQLEKASKYIITDFQENNQCPLLKVDCEKLKESAELAKIEHLKNEEKKQAAFNLEKAKNIKEIEIKGNNLKVKITELKVDNTRIQAELGTKKAELKQTFDSEKSIVVSPEIDYNNNIEYIEIINKIDMLKQQAENSKPDTTEIENQIKIKESEIESLQAELNKKSILENYQTRINELNAELIKYRAEYQHKNNLLNLIESFIKYKCDLLSEKINSNFKLCRWKLFENQINGGIKECCICEVNTNGAYVEFNSANNAGKINAGLEIINILNQHYKINLPLIIDNSEGTSRLIETQSQLILFEKPPAFKQLRAEIKKMLIENENGNTKKAEEKYNKSIEKLNVELF